VRSASGEQAELFWSRGSVKSFKQSFSSVYYFMCFAGAGGELEESFVFTHRGWVRTYLPIAEEEDYLTYPIAMQSRISGEFFEIQGWLFLNSKRGPYPCH
jgi:hypothetical protein